ncbi:hypothetical protein BVC80_8095g4 [Macleaya cordata]|uniref:Uncharacterized protein n=1 Tax=Macleaya cordata TaxID=56857 RepID=A0A200Q4C0_MACCD|nr:hypothetical protein BVC80_8095g4 [Macleaya cordata]
MIKELNLNHTCGAGFRDTSRPPMSSRLVKCLMLKELMDNPSTKPKDIIKRFKTYYGVDLEYYFAYAGRNLAMTEIYGDAAKSYSKLIWYTEALKKSNPGSHTMDLFLEVGGSAVKKFLNGAPSKHWANALFGGNRYGELFSTLAECFNSWIREERAFPITFLVDSIRVKIMNMMTAHRELCRTWSSYLCPNMENILTKKINLGRS